MPAATALCPPAKHGKTLIALRMMKLSSGSGASRMSPAGPRGNTALSPRSASNRSSGPVTPCCRKQRRLHAVLGDQRVGDVFRRGYAALAHRDRRRRARCAERNRVSDLVLGQPHQPAGHGRRDDTGNADAVPYRVRRPSMLCRGRRFRKRARSRRGDRVRENAASSAAASATGILSLGWPPRAPLCGCAPTT